MSDRPPPPDLHVVPEPPAGFFDDDGPAIADPDSPPRDDPPIDESPDAQGKLLSFPGWRNGLVSAPSGKIKPLEANLIRILCHHPEWSGVIKYNDFSQRLLAVKRTPYDDRGLTYPRQWTDTDTIRTMAWIQATKGVLVEAKHDATHHALNVVGSLNSYHPVRDYLRTLKWDAVIRLPTMLENYMGADVSTERTKAFASQVGKLWMISAVARAMRPGCQADYMLILEGKQGIGKSTALRALFSPVKGEDWFGASRLAIGSDEAFKKLQGKWCIEIAELESFRGRAWTEVKQFITDTIDNYRDTWGRRVIDRPRTVVFAGTTNDREYLGDRTGNRRFWPIHCESINREALTRDRDQLWAEAFARFASGEEWHLSDESLAREEQRKREAREPWFEIIQSWLNDPTVPNGDSTRRRIVLTDGFSQAEMLSGALNLRPTDMTTGAQMRAGWCLNKLGYERRRVRVDGQREYRYFLLGTEPTITDPGSKT